MQVTRVQRLWEKMQELGLADPGTSDLAYPQPVPLSSMTPLEPARPSRSVSVPQESPTFLLPATISWIVYSQFRCCKLPFSSHPERR